MNNLVLSNIKPRDHHDLNDFRLHHRTCRILIIMMPIKPPGLNPIITSYEIQHWKQGRFSVSRLCVDTRWGIATVPVFGPVHIYKPHCFLAPNISGQWSFLVFRWWPCTENLGNSSKCDYPGNARRR